MRFQPVQDARTVPIGINGLAVIRDLVAAAVADHPRELAVALGNDARLGLVECLPSGGQDKASFSDETGDYDELERFGDTDRAVAEVRRFLQQQHPEGEFGRGGRNVSRALYQLFTKPNLHSFREHYQAHLLLKTQPDISDDEFVKQAKIKVGSASVASAAKAYRASIASMIKYAGEGVFPIMTAAQAKRIRAYRQNRKLAAQERRREIAAGVHCIPFGLPEEPEPVLSNSVPNHGFRDFIQRTRYDKTIPSES